jgi:hypothetical protein
VDITPEKIGPGLGWSGEGIDSFRNAWQLVIEYVAKEFHSPSSGMAPKSHIHLIY